MSGLALVSTVLLAGMLGVALWNLLTAPRLERRRTARTLPTVSVLVPARNEAANLRETLPALLRLDYPHLELLVLDDSSEDETAAVVTEQRAGGGERLRLLRGSPPPPGWLGKNWACHQLAQAAGGEVLVFCDADVTVHPAALRHTVAAMGEAGAGALTAIPRQHLDGWVSRAVVPLVAQLPVLALLPLSLVPRVRAPSLSMANGQWLAFSREAYRACGGHEAVRDLVLEDVALGRRIKEAGYRLLPVVAASLLQVRMYRDAGSLREGFRKNLYPLTGGRGWTFVVALLAFALVALFPWVGALLGASEAYLPLALLAALRGCGAALFRHGVRSVLLHPAGSLLLVAIAIESYAGSRRGELQWKGRRIRAVSSIDVSSRTRYR